MKLNAVAGRGSKKDFIDLHFLFKKWSMEEAFDLLARKFQSIEYNRYHILRSLVYFEDAEGEPMPVMLQPCNWDEVKKRFETEVKVLFGS